MNPAGSAITDRFSTVSKQVNCIEKLLREQMHQGAIAQLLRELQSEEKSKLLLVRSVDSDILLEAF